MWSPNQQAASASPGNLFKLHILRPHPDLVSQKFWRVGPKNLCFNKPSTWFSCSWSLRTTVTQILVQNTYFPIIHEDIEAEYNQVLYRKISKSPNELLTILSLSLWRLLGKNTFLLSLASEVCQQSLNFLACKGTIPISASHHMTIFSLCVSQCVSSSYKDIWWVILG